MVKLQTFNLLLTYLELPWRVLSVAMPFELFNEKKVPGWMDFNICSNNFGGCPF